MAEVAPWSNAQRVGLIRMLFSNWSQFATLRVSYALENVADELYVFRPAVHHAAGMLSRMSRLYIMLRCWWSSTNVTLPRSEEMPPETLRVLPSGPASAEVS